jgi:hypothetical protein
MLHAMSTCPQKKPSTLSPSPWVLATYAVYLCIIRALWWGGLAAYDTSSLSGHLVEILKYSSRPKPQHSPST